jgi:hypothetical protein
VGRRGLRRGGTGGWGHTNEIELKIDSVNVAGLSLVLPSFNWLFLDTQPSLLIDSVHVGKSGQRRGYSCLSIA